MQNHHSADDVIDFLTHAGDKGLMPAATAQAFAVATRNVFSVLDDSERAELPINDIDAVIRRFNNKRARDFNPASLKEYGRRVKRAVEMYLKWKEDPANFTVRTRTTAARKKEKTGAQTATIGSDSSSNDIDTAVSLGASTAAATASGYQTAFPVRQGHVVTVSNIPYDLSRAEAERLSQFVRLLAQVE